METTFENHWKDIGLIGTEERVNPHITDSWYQHFSKWDERERLSADVDIQIYNNNNSITKLWEEKIFEHSHVRKYYDGFGVRSNSGTYAESFTKLKGYVTSINEEYFEARLYDEDLNGTYELGEFDLRDVDKGDMDIFKAGAVFYWIFGHFKIKGQIKKQSEIRFQRIAVIDSYDFEEITEEAQEINKSLNWE